MRDIFLFLNIFMAISIALIIWSIGKSFDNPDRLDYLRQKRIQRFKLLAVFFIIYAIMTFLLVAFK